MRKPFLTFLILVLTVLSARADEGMWLPSLIGQRIPDMHSKGFKLSAEDLYSINNASLKDAIVRFGGGCTGELVSPEGLLLTNHHCGRGQIQYHSSVENDYLTHGFWAMNRSEELPNPNLKVTFLVRMEDVTDKMLKGTKKATGEKLQDILDKNKKKIIEDATKGTHYSATVESFYYGNQYYLYVNEVFTDVRLVAAPPSSIGNFGGDTDNWMWPRHTGDFTFFRIYADKDNKPADYSADNVPYKPKKYFTVSSKGVQEGDFTMVYGFPASTNQYLYSADVDYILNYSNPTKIALRTIRLDIIKDAMERDAATRIAYAAKAASIANAWKKWQGESLGLERLGTIERKKQYEETFEVWAQDKPEFRNVISEFRNAYSDFPKYAFARDMYNEGFKVVELLVAADSVAKAVRTGNPASISNLDTFYRNYYEDVDKDLAKKLLEQYINLSEEEFIPEALTNGITAHGGLDNYIEWIYGNSRLTDREYVMGAATDTASLEVLARDPAVLLYNQGRDIYRNRINNVYTDIDKKIKALYKPYLKGMMAFQPDKQFFPDANRTLRIAYGPVKGYKPADGVTHLPGSTVEGIIEKENPEIYDYAIPDRLRQLYREQNYGRWESDGTIPVNFLAMNHTTGGNSGSPVLNADGKLIGINFDRTWLSTMSDIQFDPVMCRNIAVDIRYVLFVTEKLGNMGYLLNEMTIE